MKAIRKTSVKSIFTLALLLLLGWSNAHSQERIWAEDEANNTDMNSGMILNFLDPEAISPTSTSFTDYNPKIYIDVAFDTDLPPYEHITYQIKVKVRPYDSNGTLLPAVERIFNVEYNPSAGAGNYIDLDATILEGYYGARVRLVEFSGMNHTTGLPITTTPANLFMHGRFYVERYYDIGTAAPANLGVHTVESTDSGGGDWTAAYGIVWDEVYNALEYELEYTWIDDYGTDEGVFLPAGAIEFSERDFELNNTRVITSETFYEIPLIYASGYLVYRVRAVGRFPDDPTQVYYTNWSSDTGTNTNLGNWPDVIDVKAHEYKMNWQFQRSFAEQGKSKAVVSYFDGSLRNRQTVTKINSDDNPVVGEIIYDNQGRPAIEALPVPVYDDNVIRYYRDFTQVASGVIYTHNDFDWNNSTENCDVAATSMDNGSGASQYYGPKTATGTFQDLVPDAQGFPFSQIEYTPDNTGRVKRKSGVGPTHQLGTDHEMKYYYGVPTQEELNRLFGYRVGNAQHYKKNMVVDPNGQVSISYVDPQGRTIATALAGDTPGSLIGLEDEGSTTLHGYMTVDVLDKLNDGDPDTDLDRNERLASLIFGPHKDILEASLQHLVAKNSTALNFGYSIEIGESFSPEFCPTEVYPYVYKYLFTVEDECGNDVYADERTFGVESYDGNSIPINESFDFTSGALTIGSYGIRKDLRVDPEVLERYAQDYRAKLTDDSGDSNCYINPDDFIPQVDFPTCDPVDCETCTESFGEGEIDYVITSLINYYNNDTFAYDSTDPDGNIIVSFMDKPDDINGPEPIDQGALALMIQRFQSEWQLILDTCDSICTEFASTSCVISSSNLLRDVSPLGQYGSIEILEGETTVDEPLSVFNEANVLYNFATGTVGGVHWKSPNSPYMDAVGNPAQVVVIENPDPAVGGYLPEVTGGVSNGTNPDGSTYLYVAPTSLMYVADFISAWEPSWANSLVATHPEYCYLTYAELVCALVDNVTVNGESVSMDSDGYDSYIQSLDTWEEAKLAGLVTSGNYKKLMDEDPYFSAIIDTDSPFDGDLWDMRKAIMKEAMQSNYEGAVDSNDNPANLLMYAFILGNCNGISDCTPSATHSTLFNAIDGLGSIDRQNNIWKLYVGNYIGLKSRIKHVFMNAYALENGCFNGCIGEEISAEVTNVIDTYTNKAAIQAHINDNTADQFCDQPGAEAYADRERRFVPVDAFYNSGVGAGDAITEMEGDNDYINYVETGNCPLYFDLDIFLKGYFSETDASGLLKHPVRSGDLFLGPYLTPDLYEALGGDLDNVPGDILIDGTNSSNVLSIELSGASPSGPISAADAILIDPGSFSWGNYSVDAIIPAGKWRLVGVRNLYFSQYNASTERFEFEFIAMIEKSGSVIEEALFTGSTVAAIGECGLNDDGVGEVLDDQMSDPDSPYGCTRQAKFKRDLILLVNALKGTGAINATAASPTNLNAYSQWTDSFLPEFLEDDAVAGGATWYVEYLPDPVYRIEGVGVNFTLNMTDGVDLGSAAVQSVEGIHYENYEFVQDDIKIHYINPAGNLVYTNASFKPGLPYSCCDDRNFELEFNLRKYIPNGCVFEGTPALKYRDFRVIVHDLYLLGDRIDYSLQVDFINTWDDVNPMDESDIAVALTINGASYSTALGNVTIEDAGDTCVDNASGSNHRVPYIYMGRDSATAGNAAAFYQIFELGYSINGNDYNFNFLDDQTDPNPPQNNIGTAMTTTGSSPKYLWVDDAIFGPGVQVTAGRQMRWRDPKMMPPYTFQFRAGDRIGTSGQIIITAENGEYTYAGNTYQGGNIFNLDSDDNNLATPMYALEFRTNNGDGDATCETCVAQTVQPVPCDPKYDDFLVLAAGIDGYAVPPGLDKQRFCDLNYAYLVDSYTSYLTDLGISSTESVGFIDIATFGETDLNYGYEFIEDVIDAYAVYVDDYSGDPALMLEWTEWVNTVHIPSLGEFCPPAPLAIGEIIIDGEVDPCDEQVSTIIGTYSQEAYDNYIDGLVEQFIAGYIDTAMSNVVENLDMEYYDKEYQYTLYYYDQAGNLAQTVAPEGVQRFDLTTGTLNDLINTHRNSGQNTEVPFWVPNHGYQTQYRYNSLNQLVWQKTPDGGETRFAYDDLGRIIASQNANQVEGANTTTTVLESAYDPITYSKYSKNMYISDNGHQGQQSWRRDGWAFAISDQSISGDGFLRRTLESAGPVHDESYLGLSYNPEGELNQVDYAFHLFSGFKYETIVNGSATASGTFTTGDVFEIKRESGMISYRVNGSEVYSTPEFAAGNLYIDMGIYTAGSVIENIEFGSCTEVTTSNPYQWFSYTTYDGLGRVVEAGEFNAIDEVGINDNGRLYNVNTGEEYEIDPNTYPLPYVFYEPAGSAIQSFKQVTHTYYDTAAPLFEDLDGGTGADFTDALFETSYDDFNSRNRVTAVVYFDDIFGSPINYGKYHNLIAYNYDVHGNVKELANYFRWTNSNITDLDQQIRRIQYDYDLISGNVHRVTIQPGKPDQFIHKYEYDADNRITQVATSASGYVWEQEAVYEYYHHGPLARVLIGDKEVQGMDYVYTLQGWLKSVNGESLDDLSFDPGTDGDLIGGNSARDAMGYSLTYYYNDDEKDYTPSVGFAAGSNPYQISSVSGSVFNSDFDLYNGNIKQMVTSIRENNNANLPTQSNRYRYDQLNRIKLYNSSSINNTTGIVLNNAYDAAYRYDRNGNLTSLNRNVGDVTMENGGNPIRMDEFTYNYKLGNNQLTIVGDDVDGSVLPIDYENDLEDQFDQLNAVLGTTYDINNTDTHNYVYDAIGQLILDRTEGLTIEWRVDGKVDKVTKVPLGSNDPNATEVITFIYDGLGNRIAKTVKRGGSSDLETTYYVRDAQGNPLSVYKENSEEGGLRLNLIENQIYGSSRLGLESKSQLVYDSNGTVPTVDLLQKTVGDKRYELSNHLGNVLSVISDKKTPILSGSTLTAFNPDIKAYNDYYPFGMLMPNRHFNTSDYRYGFNGMEQDDELKGVGNSYDYGARMYDPRIGRWFSMDRYDEYFPQVSPYSYSLNSPLMFTDKNGDFPWPVFLKGAVISAFSETTFQMIDYMILEGDFNFKSAIANVDWTDVGVEAGTGGLRAVFLPWSNYTAKRVSKLFKGKYRAYTFYLIKETITLVEESLNLALKDYANGKEINVVEVLTSVLGDKLVGEIMSSQPLIPKAMKRKGKRITRKLDKAVRLEQEVHALNDMLDDAVDKGKRKKAERLKNRIHKRAEKINKLESQAASMLSEEYSNAGWTESFKGEFQSRAKNTVKKYVKKNASKAKVWVEGLFTEGEDGYTPIPENEMEENQDEGSGGKSN
ncbi:RHS repeat domain-containing protein [Gilvibacter sp.]|uniref:RHS repeat domain-containing protein n=1 Tax=Gilvibacter sp. TaxID=2729997 RepID=UPI003F4A3C1A